MTQTESRLARAPSPYLRSAAHQPVEWYEWGEEAFARACAEDKPILLDIGAVWCHWCHVIDRESYENPETAALINQLFVPVKVDRDERPDVDSRYQSAVSAVSGQGGWPLTGFLLPDGRPFFGGTYFPPEDGMGRPSFRRVLVAMAEAYRSRRADVEQAAVALAGAVAQAESFEGAAGTLEAGALERLVDSIAQHFDFRNGGFSRAPKFPHAQAMDLLLDQCQFAAEGGPHLLTVAQITLERMARGGVYDQLAGGFHRYSVDEYWRVPHFEKMSYDNSELLKNYLHAWQVTGVPLFRRTAETIIGWVNAVLSDRERGGFYASQDADQSLDDDGDYFTWSLAELAAVLTPEEARAAELRYGVEERGQMHHNPAKNTLCIASEVPEISGAMALPESQVVELLDSLKPKMLAARLERPEPFVDRTHYVSWNAMFCSAYLEAARVLRDDLGAGCREFALRTLDRMLREAWNDALGFAHRIGGEWLDGTLDDQVFAATALLDAYEATLDPRYFDAARRAADFFIAQYADSAAGGFFDRPAGAAPLGGLDIRRKPLQDSPTPAANSAAAIVLDRLHEYTSDARYREAAQKTLECFAKIAPEYGLHAATYGLALLLHTRHGQQVVITGRAGDPAAKRLEETAAAGYRFGKAVLRVTPERAAAGALAPALAETIPHLRADVAQALVCSGTSCQPPVSDPGKLQALLAELGAP